MKDKKAPSGKMTQFVKDVQHKAELAKQRLVAAAEPMKWVGLRVVAIVEITAMAFGFGYFRAYYGEKKFLGLPIDAWAGIGLNVVGGAIALSSKSGKKGAVGRMIGEQVCNLGNGALAIWSGSMGAGYGAEAKAAKDQGGGAQAPSPVVAGMPSAFGGTGWGPPALAMPPGYRSLEEELTAAPGMVAAGLV